MKGPILCFVGPPGVGKTSIGKSIARALGRKFVRISLGGVRDEAEIRGHRRTYVGALPGGVVHMIRRAESNDPVFMLDEIEKVGQDWRGDPSSALLEVLDPEQNRDFRDHYLDVPFDLGRVMFITTANTLEGIPRPLQDRMEIIRIAGYTEVEKQHIASRYLVKKQREATGLKEGNLAFEDDAIVGVIRNYTRESGVRNLEREIANISRKVARRVVQDGRDLKMVVGPDDLREHLGVIKFRDTKAEEKNEVGLATGLAWTEVGGQILNIEATVMTGKGKQTLTGKLGDVMQESAQAALSYVRSRTSRLGLPADFYRRVDIHIHIPEGAIPKDGPSAGITLATAMVSALTKIPVDRDIAMTGEITLRGKVLPIGGVKEKILAAHRAGIRTVLLPRDNEKDLSEIPENIQEDLAIKFVETMDEVLDLALERKIEGIAALAAEPEEARRLDATLESDRESLTN
jgi:ATP-dependent Lon protease